MATLTMMALFRSVIFSLMLAVPSNSRCDRNASFHRCRTVAPQQPDCNRLLLSINARSGHYRSISVARSALGDLQIKGHTFAIDEYGSRVQELLAGAIVFRVTAQRRKRKEEFHGFGYGGRRL